MANQEHMAILKQGVEVWNAWRKEHPEIQPDLSGIDFNDEGDAALKYSDFGDINLNEPDWEFLSLTRVKLYSHISSFLEDGLSLMGIDLHDVNLIGCSMRWLQLLNVDLRGSNLSGANLSDTFLREVNLSEATLTGADLHDAFFYKVSLSEATIDQAELRTTLILDSDLSDADFSGSKLEGVCFLGVQLNGATFLDTDLREAWFVAVDLNQGDLSDSDLRGAKFYSANLNEADLTGARLVQTEWHNSTLSNCKIYGISAWNLRLENTTQLDLIITDPDEAIITVDNLEVAQFIYLLLNNSKIRDVIDTIAKKAVLILGRFTPERKPVLDALKEVLRSHDYLPILFDFNKPASRDITETVSTLAHLSRFVIADITDAKSIPQELMSIVPSLPSVPVQPLLLESQYEYGMFEHFTRYPWVLPTYRYQDIEGLLASLQTKVIEPAEQKAQELEKR